MAERTVVVVLGPHRAGTSLTTSIVAALGVPLSTDLMPATDDNPAGYFESLEIVKAHEALLAALGRSWQTSSRAVPFPSGWWLSAKARPHRKKIAAIVERELRRTGGLWGFKDPRTAQLLPLWKHVFSELGVRAKYVLAVRDPRAVAKSLAARDGMTLAEGEMLWFEHVSDAMKYAGGELCLSVDYDRWFTDGAAQLHALASALNLPASGAAAMLEGTVRSEYRRQTSEGEFALPFVAEFYRDMLTKSGVSAA